MSSLPSGVVTFLMTDIVGSTPMWERAPHHMDIALQRHDALIEAAVVEHHGFVLRHRGEGDSTFSVFQSATDALRAAHEAQRRLRSERWPAETPILVRMGVHSGTPLVRSGEYHGRVVNRAARVRSNALGGQILVSGTTAALVDGLVPERTELRFVRMAELRGIDDAEAVHELLDPSLPPLPAAATDQITPEPATLPPLLATAMPRQFSGRRSHLDTLSAVRDDALRRGATALLQGEPGAGKTSLAAVVAAHALEAGWQVLAGACDEAGTVPYGAIREIIRAAVDRAPQELLTNHVMVHGGAIGHLTDRLVARIGAIGPDRSLDIDTTRRLLGDAVEDLLQRTVALQPLLIVADDLQWADRNTLEILERVAETAAPGLMLVGTYRAGHADVTMFGAWLASVGRSADPTVLTVDGLGTDELRELLVGLAGHDLGADGDALATHLRAETAGNPFLVVELIRLLVQQGVVATDSDGRWRLTGDLTAPTTLHTARNVVAARLGRLEGPTVRILEAAAVLGRDFDPSVVAQVLQTDELDVLDALEPALHSSLLREMGADEFQFSHALVQHALYDALGDTRRGALHRRVASTLAADERRGRHSAAVVAGHWLRAGRVDPAVLADWCRRAGDESMAAIAPDDAVRWFQHALAAATDDPTRLEVMIELGKAQRWVDGASFRGTLLAAASLAETLGDGDALVRAALANHRGGASRAGTVDVERIAVLERALGHAGPTDSPERAVLLATIAMEGSQGSDITRSIELADESVAVARRLGDDDTLFTVLLRITEAIRIPATLERRLRDTDELFDIALRLDDPVQLGFAAVREIRTKFEAAQFDRVDRPFEVLEPVAHLDPFVHHNQSSLRAVRAQFAGDLSAALAHAEEARRLGVSENDATAVYLSTTSMIRWDMGALSDMLPPLERICREFPGVVGFQPTAGLARLAAGDETGAASILDDAANRRFEHVPLNPLWAMTVSVFGTLCVDLAHERSAPLLYDLLLPLQGRANISVVSGNGLVDETLAGLARVAGRPDAAAHHARAALEQASALGLLPSVARMQLALATLTGNSDQARQARDLASHLGMARVAAQAAAEAG